MIVAQKCLDLELLIQWPFVLGSNSSPKFLFRVRKKMFVHKKAKTSIVFTRYLLHSYETECLRVFRCFTLDAFLESKTIIYMLLCNCIFMYIP